MTLIKTLYMLLNVLFFIFFIIHVSNIGYQSMYPAVPEIVVYKKELSEIEFPLLFRICLFEHQNKTDRFQKYGYNDVVDYFNGVSKFNRSMLGWAGHAENGTTLGSVAGKFGNLLP